MLNRQQIIDILHNCKHKDWRIEIAAGWDSYEHGVRAHWVVPVMCSKTGQPIVVTTPIRFLDYRLTEKRVVQLVRNAVHEMVVHEADEFFRYHGVMVFDPHYGEKGYEPERTIPARTTLVPRDPRRAIASYKNSSDAIGVEPLERLHDIDPNDYIQFR